MKVSTGSVGVQDDSSRSVKRQSNEHPLQQRLAPSNPCLRCSYVFTLPRAQSRPCAHLRARNPCSVACLYTISRDRSLATAKPFYRACRHFVSRDRSLTFANAFPFSFSLASNNTCICQRQPGLCEPTIGSDPRKPCHHTSALPVAVALQGCIYQHVVESRLSVRH
jgi:hypothetical protein